MKKITAIIIALLLSFSLAACGESTNTSSTESVSTTASNPVIQNEYDTKYLKWNAAEWNQATDDDKKGCAKAYLGYIGDLMGMKVTDADLENLDDTIKSLDTVFASSTELSLMEIVQYGLTTE